MMRPNIHEDVIHTDHERYPDFVEVGKAGSRIHIAFSADRPEEAIDRIDEALTLRDYCVNSLLAQAEREVGRIQARKVQP
jgi:hypothetical protein